MIVWGGSDEDSGLDWWDCGGEGSECAEVVGSELLSVDIVCLIYSISACIRSYKMWGK